MIPAPVAPALQPWSYIPERNCPTKTNINKKCAVPTGTYKVLASVVVLVDNGTGTFSIFRGLLTCTRYFVQNVICIVIRYGTYT